MRRPPYVEALFQALLAGHYVPELMDVYFRTSNFQIPHAWPMDFGH